MGAFCCHGNQSFDPIFPKTLGSLSPTPVMLHIKFDRDWPTGFRDIQVWKCGRRTTYNNGRRTDDGTLVYYKLTLWAFGSGELKIKAFSVYNIVSIVSLWEKFSVLKGKSKLKAKSPIWPDTELVKILSLSLLPASLMKILWKNEGAIVLTFFLVLSGE